MSCSNQQLQSTGKHSGRLRRYGAEEIRHIKVFMGGTCNESTWRDHMMIYLHDDGLEWFNPVVDDWDEEAQANELRERKVCDFCLYTITPKMTRSHAIAEVVDDSNKRPEKTVFVLLRSGDAQTQHCQEDALREAFIQSIARRQDGLGEKARLVLSTNNLAFNRWCA